MQMPQVCPLVGVQPPEASTCMIDSFVGSKYASAIPSLIRVFKNHFVALRPGEYVVLFKRSHKLVVCLESLVMIGPMYVNIPSM